MTDRPLEVVWVPRVTDQETKHIDTMKQLKNCHLAESEKRRQL